VQPISTEHIEVTPGTCGGRPRIAGTRIRVQDIVAMTEHEGLDPDMIVSQFPQLSLADVHAALAYYHDHLPEVREQMRGDDNLASDMQGQIGSKLPVKPIKDNV
jgi:uncharacterized protein (DUF433 family)